MINFEHVSVLLNECINGLDLKPNGIYVDGTLGGAGHALSICKKLSSQGTFIGIDQDDNALAISKERLSNVTPTVEIIKSNFEHLDEVVNKKIDGMLIDQSACSPPLAR